MTYAEIKKVLLELKQEYREVEQLEEMEAAEQDYIEQPSLEDYDYFVGGE